MVTLIGAADSTGAGTVSERQWAQIGSVGPGSQAVDAADLTPTKGAGTREVDVAAGIVKSCNCIGIFTGSTALTVTANSGSSDRTDKVVAEFNWQETASTAGTGPNSVELKVLPSNPTLEHRPGVLWQVPIATVVVPAGGGGITVADARPTGGTTPGGPSAGNTVGRNPFNATDPAPGGAIQSVSMTGPGGNWNTLAIVQVPDPGYSYRLAWSAQVDYVNVASGHVLLDVTIDGTVTGPQGRTDEGNHNPGILPYFMTVQQGGGCTVRLRMLPSGNTPTGTVMQTAINEFCYFLVSTIPA